MAEMNDNVVRPKRNLQLRKIQNQYMIVEASAANVNMSNVYSLNKTAADLCVKVKDIVYPNKDNTEKYSVIFDEYKRIHDALAPIYKER